jgi:predicted DNA-binding protein with PD1-like motif
MQAVHDGPRWVVRLDDGDDLFGALSGWAEREAIRAAGVLFGIGMFREASIGYWNGSEYHPTELSAPHEVVALHGTIARAEGRPSIHLHCGLAGPNHQLIGGHLLRAKIGVVQEIGIEAFPGRSFGRPLVESFGLRILDLEPGASG